MIQPSPAVQGETFLRAPRAQAHDLGTGQLAVVGVPHELTKISRPGTSGGPEAIRRATLMFDYYVGEMARGEIADLEREEAWVYDKRALVDLGDLVMTPDLDVNTRRIEEAIAAVAAADALPIMLGGDHYVTWPAVTGLARARALAGQLAYLHVDMHADLADIAPGFGKRSCGSPVRRLIEEGTLDPKRVVIYGVESMLLRDEWEFARSHGLRLVGSAEVDAKGVAATLPAALEPALAGAAGLYVSIDIDVLARHYAPGTGNATGVTGLTPAQLIEIVRTLHDLPLVGIDLVEVAPNWDPTGRTAGIAATVLQEALWPRLFTAAA